jgi:hypothetical protein
LPSPKMRATAILRRLPLSATIVSGRRRKKCRLVYSQLILANTRSTSTASTAMALAQDQSREAGRGDRGTGASNDRDGGLRERALLGPALSRRWMSGSSDQPRLREAVRQRIEERRGGRRRNLRGSHASDHALHPCQVGRTTGLAIAPSRARPSRLRSNRHYQSYAGAACRVWCYSSARRVAVRRRASCARILKHRRKELPRFVTAQTERKLERHGCGNCGYRCSCDHRDRTRARKADFVIWPLTSKRLLQSLYPLEPNGIPNCSAACRQRSRSLSRPE